MFGLNGISHWLILLVVVLLIFGSGKLRSVGCDLGKAISGFRKGLTDDEPGSAEVSRVERDGGDGKSPR